MKTIIFCMTIILISSAAFAGEQNSPKSNPAITNPDFSKYSSQSVTNKSDQTNIYVKSRGNMPVSGHRAVAVRQDRSKQAVTLPSQRFSGNGKNRFGKASYEQTP